MAESLKARATEALKGVPKGNIHALVTELLNELERAARQQRSSDLFIFKMGARMGAFTRLLESPEFGRTLCELAEAKANGKAFTSEVLKLYEKAGLEVEKMVRNA